MTSPTSIGPTMGLPRPAEPPASTPAQVAGAEPAADAAAPAAAAAATPPGRVIAVAAVPPAPSSPPTNESDPDGDGPTTSPSWRARRHRRLRRLRIGHHAASGDELDRLQLTGSAFGLLLGRDQAGGPVAVTLFRPEPTEVVLIGGPWAAELVTFRSLGFGARTVVFTAEPDGWIELGRRATGRTDRVAVLELGSPVRMSASVDAPVLRLGGAHPLASEGLPPWTTRLSVLSQVTPAQAELLASADIVLSQRLSPAESETLAPIRQLTAGTVHTLQVLGDDMLAVLTSAGTRYAWVHATAAERELLSEPYR
ncbi:hypothetical protein JQS43_02820 [Natronosporangium hydrolyticum]|uniref:Uncharacterized protein n=1 Tax=Natronosporangium hydrolyticum TaxID=2811111 RepID=A0A895YIX0_9ACTN|nr:hypothetical protein [Natronosporangium hydrolyticum]QSB15313.1 hypothetical protein JQS43_02820 [Natronosporangium hydrolyticum]